MYHFIQRSTDVYGFSLLRRIILNISYDIHTCSNRTSIHIIFNLIILSFRFDCTIFILFFVFVLLLLPKIDKINGNRQRRNEKHENQIDE